MRLKPLEGTPMPFIGIEIIEDMFATMRARREAFVDSASRACISAANTPPPFAPPPVLRPLHAERPVPLYERFLSTIQRTPYWRPTPAHTELETPPPEPIDHQRDASRGRYLCEECFDAMTDTVLPAAQSPTGMDMGVCGACNTPTGQPLVKETPIGPIVLQEVRREV